MKKRMFIDLVRQYATAAQRKGLDATTLVNTLGQQRLAQLREEGVSDVEIQKESLWQEAFIEREYTPFVPLNAKNVTG